MNDALHSLAIYDAKNGKTDADQFDARMELLKSNPNVDSRPTQEMGTVVKQFFELSNETQDTTDDQFPAEFYNQPDFAASDDEAEEEPDEETDEECDEELEASRKSGDESYNRTGGICIRTVIKQERVKVSNADHTVYGIHCISHTVSAIEIRQLVV